MNFADLENVWRSPHNRPTANELEQQKMQFVDELRRRRRGNLFFILLSGLPLLIFTALVVRHVFWPAPTDTPVDLRREWVIIPFYALPWLGWFFMVRQHQKLGRRSRHCERTISACLTALLDENKSERARYKFIGGVLLAAVALLPLVVWQLRSVGKAGDEIFLPFLVLMPALLLGIVLWMAIHYRRRLMPRERQLEAILRAGGHSK